MKTFFTADTHFEHENVLKMCQRSFSSIEEHDDHLLIAINQKVQRDDRLFILGDFAWRNGKQVFERINCRNVHLIIGNHDRPGFARFFKSTADTAIVRIGEHKIFLSHYPHAYWPSSHRGSLHLYGHVHSEREATLDLALPARRAMDCGVDNAKKLLGSYEPFSEDEIIGLLAFRAGHDFVEFYTYGGKEKDIPGHEKLSQISGWKVLPSQTNCVFVTGTQTFL